MQKANNNFVQRKQSKQTTVSAVAEGHHDALSVEILLQNYMRKHI